MSSRARAITLSLVSCSVLACGGGGGGGGSSPAVEVGFAAPESAINETRTSASIEIVLSLTAPPLADALTVTVRDAGTGRAIAGEDYDAIDGLTFTFPAGSQDGATHGIELAPINDERIEGHERVVLALECPGAAVGGGEHVLELRDDERAHVRFVESVGAVSAEDDGSVATEVELTYDAGLVLAARLDVAVAITDQGGATEGHDLAHAGTGTIRFEEGSASGERRTVEITLLDDEVPEADEDAVLELSAENSAVELGGGATHEFVITDDDVSPDPFLAAESDAGGTLLPIENGEAIDLGEQPLGGDGGEGVALTLANLGLAPLALGPLVMEGANPREFQVELETYSYRDGAHDGARHPAEPAVLPFPFTARADERADAAALAPDLDLLAELARHDRVRLLGPELDGEIVELALERVPLPLRHDAVIVVDGAPSEAALAELRATLTVWRGAVAGRDGSRVLLCLSPHGARGWIALGAGASERYELAAVRTDAGLGLRVVSSLEAAALAERAGAPPPLCAEPLAMPGWSATEPAPDEPPRASFATAALAIESDYQLYQRLGSVNATTAYVTGMVAAVSDRYLADAQTLLTIAYLRVWSTAADPWTTPDVPGTTFEMLEEFRAAWSPSFGGAWPADAQLAHFLSGANLGGGIAYLDALCNQVYGFGVSANLNGNLDWSDFDGEPSGATWDFVVFAHELGHNFGARHTHEYCPPLDRCASSCDGIACSEGTLMSYCHQCTGGMRNIRLEFHPHVANVLRQSAAEACLEPTRLALGEELGLRLRFRPTATTGARSATLSIDHDARNTSSPFELALEGDAQP